MEFFTFAESGRDIGILENTMAIKCINNTATEQLYQHSSQPMTLSLSKITSNNISESAYVVHLISFS